MHRERSQSGNPVCPPSLLLLQPHLHCCGQLSAMRQAMWHCTLASHHIASHAPCGSNPGLLLFFFYFRLFELGEKKVSSSPSDNFERNFFYNFRFFPFLLFVKHFISHYFSCCFDYCFHLFVVIVVVVFSFSQKFNNIQQTNLIAVWDIIDFYSHWKTFGEIPEGGKLRFSRNLREENSNISAFNLLLKQSQIMMA